MAWRLSGSLDRDAPAPSEMAKLTAAGRHDPPLKPDQVGRRSPRAFWQGGWIQTRLKCFTIHVGHVVRPWKPKSTQPLGNVWWEPAQCAWSVGRDTVLIVCRLVIDHLHRDVTMSQAVPLATGMVRPVMYLTKHLWSLVEPGHACTWQETAARQQHSSAGGLETETKPPKAAPALWGTAGAQRCLASCCCGGRPLCRDLHRARPCRTRVTRQSSRPVSPSSWLRFPHRSHRTGPLRFIGA